MDNFFLMLFEKFQHPKMWIAEIFIVVFTTLVFAFFIRRFVNKLAKKAEATSNPWDDTVVHAVRRPITLLIWLLGISFAATVGDQHTEVSFTGLITKVREVGIIAIGCWFLIRLIKEVERNLTDPYVQEKPFDPTTARAMGKLLRAAIVITALLIIMQSLGYSVSGILAFGGIGGLAVGFAAKDLLANFFGGLMIYLDRPFRVGDWIRSPDKSIEGTVEDIGWRLTRIRTFDKRPLYVPNSIFTQIALENPSRMLNRRIYETIGIRYCDAGKMNSIVDEVSAMLKKHPEIDLDQTLIVNFNAFAPSSLNFFIYCFTKTTDWIKFHGIKQDVMLQIISIIERNGAECAFPTSTVHIASGGIPVVSDAHQQGEINP